MSINISGSLQENSLPALHKLLQETSSIAASPAWNAGLFKAAPHFLGAFVCELAYSQNLYHLQSINVLGPIS